MADNDNTSDGSLSLADTLWIPAHEVAVAEWNATAGSMVTGGTAIGKIPGSLAKLTIKNGTASAQERSLTIFGITGTLPANTTEITDAGFLQQVEANDSYQSVDVESRKAGFDATLALSERMRVLRVPAGAVFGINDSTGCIVPTSNNHGNTPVKVSIVGGELGVSSCKPTAKTSLRSPMWKSAADLTISPASRRLCDYDRCFPKRCAILARE